MSGLGRSRFYIIVGLNKITSKTWMYQTLPKPIKYKIFCESLSLGPYGFSTERPKKSFAGPALRQDAVTSFKMEEEVSASLADPFVARLVKDARPGKLPVVNQRKTIGKTIGKPWETTINSELSHKNGDNLWIIYG